MEKKKKKKKKNQTEALAWVHEDYISKLTNCVCIYESQGLKYTPVTINNLLVIQKSSDKASCV